jgi:peptidoglycan/xylan/chitin deacetylase (PgdA/CDA1 family)
MTTAGSPPPAASRRVVVFTGPPLRDATVECVEALARAHSEWSFLVVCGGLRVARGRWLRGKLRRLAREPLSYPLELAGQAARRVLGTRPPTRTALPALETGALPNVAVAHFERIHGDDCLQRVREHAPWLGISLGAPLLRESLFRIPALGTINLHKSLLPEYRGMPPAFWELADGAQRTGVSVHWMEAGLDTGDVVRQEELDIEPYTTVAGLQARLDDAGVRVLCAAVADLDVGRAVRGPQGNARTATRSRPPYLLAKRLSRQLARRRQPARSAAGAVREAAKRAVMWGFVHLWAPLRNAWRARRGGCHTAIVLYHRVSDRFLDAVTVGVEQFDRQTRMLARRYQVLDLSTWLAESGRKRRRPAVVLTFDDGYADNHLAARLLRRAGLPCTFFLCTRIVGSDTRFPQDVQKEVAGAPPLTWEQVREMAGWGMSFGSHTMHHANVGKIPHEQALEEIRGAAADLARELPRTPAPAWFAYPYGRRGDITEQVRRALPELGVEWCFSAYGGINLPQFDRYNVLRQGVSHNVSDLALRALVEGWRPR